MSAQVIHLADYRPPAREPLLTIAQLQERYGMSRRWWAYRIAEGLPRHRWGGHYRYRASEVEAWIMEQSRQIAPREGMASGADTAAQAPSA